MNVKRWIRKHKFNKLLNEQRKAPNNRKLLLELVKFLDPYEFTNYNPAIGQSIVFDTRYRNIEILTNKLKEYILTIKLEDKLSNGIDSDPELTVNLDNFFTTNNGRYVNVQNSVFELRKNVIELCHLLVDADKLDYGLMAHNYRLLTKTLNFIRKLFIHLNEMALMN